MEANLLILKDWLFGLHVPDLYSSSFSYKSDDLMMWRSYAAPPTGICIGFNGAALHDAVESEMKAQSFSYVIGKARYLVEGQALKEACFTPSTKAFIEKLKLSFSSEIKKHALDVSDKFEQQLWRELRDELDLHSIMYKHSAFKAEQEFRFVASIWSKKNLRFRQYGANFNSYCEVNIPNLLSLIETVVIGPTPEGERTLNSIRHFMEAKGIDPAKCTIDVSKIPYRAW